MKRVLLSLIMILVILSSVAIVPVAAEESENKTVLTAVYKGKEDNRHCYDLILSGSQLCYIQFAVTCNEEAPIEVKNTSEFDFMAGKKCIFYANANMNCNSEPFAKLYIDIAGEPPSVPEIKFTDIEAFNYEEQVVCVMISIDNSLYHSKESMENNISTNDTTETTSNAFEELPSVTETENAPTTEAPNEIIDSTTAMTGSQPASSNITDNKMPLHQILFICAGVMLVLGIISGIICISISRKENT